MSPFYFYFMKICMFFVNDICYFYKYAHFVTIRDYTSQIEEPDFEFFKKRSHFFVSENPSHMLKVVLS